MKIPQRLSWGGITSITERTPQAREGWGKSRGAAKDLYRALGRAYPQNGAHNFATDFRGQVRFQRRSVLGALD